MGWDLLKKIASGMDGSIMDGKGANDQKEQIQEENKKPEKDKDPKKKKESDKPENANSQAGPVPAEKTTKEAPPAGAEAVPAEPGTEQPPEQQAAPTTTVGISQIIDFLQANPNPDDAAVHAFAEQNGADIHQLETSIYGLSSKMVNFLRGGKFIDSGSNINSIDPTELEAGVAIESEHTPDPSIAKKIALDHLVEIPDYYSRLKVMEQSAKSEAGAAAVPKKDDGYNYTDGTEETKEMDSNQPVGANNRSEL